MHCESTVGTGFIGVCVCCLSLQVVLLEFESAVAHLGQQSRAAPSVVIVVTEEARLDADADKEECESCYRSRRIRSQ